MKIITIMIIIIKSRRLGLTVMIKIKTERRNESVSIFQYFTISVEEFLCCLRFFFNKRPIKNRSHGISLTGVSQICAAKTTKIRRFPSLFLTVCFSYMSPHVYNINLRVFDFVCILNFIYLIVTLLIRIFFYSHHLRPFVFIFIFLYSCNYFTHTRFLAIDFLPAVDFIQFVFGETHHNLFSGAIDNTKTLTMTTAAWVKNKKMA